MELWNYGKEINISIDLAAMSKVAEIGGNHFFILDQLLICEV